MPRRWPAYVENLLELRDRGDAVPFVQRRLADGQLVGCTRYMDIRSWSGRGVPDEVEIGGTWLAASAQRTPINTEAKLLLLTHAFETWEVYRVALATDARNERSRTAIARIGASFEGELRNHRWSFAPGEAGQPRTTALVLDPPRRVAGGEGCARGTPRLTSDGSSETGSFHRSSTRPGGPMKQYPIKLGTMLFTMVEPHRGPRGRVQPLVRARPLLRRRA